MNLDGTTMTADGTKVTRRQYQLLSLFAKNKDKLLTKEEIYKVLWPTKRHVNSLAVLINFTRRILPQIEIETIHGSGYIYRGER